MLDAALDGSIAHATGRSRNLRDLLRDDVGMKPVKGLDWGLARLDRDVGAIPEAALTILGASPGVGKTSLALTVLLHLATAGVPVLIFSLEMSEAQLMHTLAARGARVSAGRLRRLGYCGLHPDERARMEGWMAALYDKASPCLYVETRHNRIAEIAAHARRMQRQHGIVLVVVDYLQLISREPGEESRRLGIDATVNALKRLAKDSGLSVMLLSQLSRSPTNEPPTMSRLKESGGIEEAADMILLLHRPQFRQWDTCQDCGGAQVANCQRCHGDGQVSRDTRLDVHVEKNKFGPAGFACKFTWDGPYMTISEWRESDAER
jgi:replicative DNA helicase